MPSVGVGGGLGGQCVYAVTCWGTGGRMGRSERTERGGVLDPGLGVSKEEKGRSVKMGLVEIVEVLVEGCAKEPSKFG